LYHISQVGTCILRDDDLMRLQSVPYERKSNEQSCVSFRTDFGRNIYVYMYITLY
jgi:hypothetical protein